MKPTSFGEAAAALIAADPTSGSDICSSPEAMAVAVIVAVVAAAVAKFKSASFTRWLQYPHFWTDFDHSHGKLGVLEVVRFVELHHLSIQRLISGLWTHFRIPITSSSKVCSKCCFLLLFCHAVLFHLLCGLRWSYLCCMCIVHTLISIRQMALMAPKFKLR